MKKNWNLVVVPKEIERTVSSDFPYTLDEQGRLVALASDQIVGGTVLNVPYSLYNLRVLSRHPLMGAENMPVFVPDLGDPVFKQCGACPGRTVVYLMSQDVVGKNLSLAKQVELVNPVGFEVTPLLVRATYAAGRILTTGTYHDEREPLTFARSPDRVQIGNSVCPTILGGFALGSGATVLHNFLDKVCTGVAPGCPVEVLPALGT
jgi:hypothetical protein